MIALQVFDSPAKAVMLLDLTGRAEGVQFSTNRRGFSSLSVGFIALSLYEAFALYEWRGTPHMVATGEDGGVAWEGRLEDIAIVPGGLSLTAFGYQRALSDLLYTALWSASGTAGWRPVTDTDITGRTPERYEMDNNNRLYIAPKKGESFGHKRHNGDMSFAVPHLSVRGIKSITANYDMLLPSGWALRILTGNDDFSGLAVESTITATGSAQTGSISLDVTEKPRIQVGIWNATGSTYNNTSETGTFYVRLTNVRVKSVTKTTSVLASDIAASLVTYTNGINPTQLSGEVAQIQATATDLLSEMYEDARPADILTGLATRHQYVWSVWEGRGLWFQPAAAVGRQWYIDIGGGLDLQRSLDNVVNRVYATYRDASNQTLRTGKVTGDVEKFGVTRDNVLDARTTSSTQAESQRDALLTDQSIVQLRAKVGVKRLVDALGVSAPFWAVRAGDTVTIRDLPPTLGSEVDNIRTFRVGGTDYNVSDNVLTITPDTPVPTLVTLTADRGRGG